MGTTQIFKIGTALGLAAALSACAFGRTYSYSDTPISLQAVSSTGAVTVAVQDERPYVISGAKPTRFVGLMRGGFGNPFDVNTSSGGPLAKEIGDAIVRAMKARGIDARPVEVQPNESMIAVKRDLNATRPHRGVLVTLREWKSDTMMSTDLHYDVSLTVFDESGNGIASSSIRGMDNLGSLGMSPNEGISKASARKLDQLFDDEKVIAALK
jgi:hypothetical protein